MAPLLTAARSGGDISFTFPTLAKTLSDEEPGIRNHAANTIYRSAQNGFDVL